MNDPEDIPLDVVEALEAIAEDYLRALRAGESPTPAKVVEANPRLAPWLERRLAVLGAFHEAATGRATRGIPEGIGRFQVIELLGQGTFGTVYKARDNELGRVVAIKVPRAGYFETEEDEDRFLREARSAAAIRHPGIVQVYEIADAKGIPFIVSEFVEGRTLAELISNCRPGFRNSAELVAQTSDALHHAHQAKVIHRDVKPANILVDASGKPHVSDFGLARREEGEATMTIEGQIIGTPAYMSPEQASGQHARVGPQSDVYSLGVVLYELLTGERPFRGQRSMVIQQVLNDEPRPPHALESRVPRDLETICLKAMAKEPGRRYATARDFGLDLSRFLNGEPIRARPVSGFERLWRWARRNPAVATLSAVVFLVLTGATMLSSTLAIRADKAREEATQRLSRLNVRTGMQLVTQGDLLGALPWLAEAQGLDQGDAPRTEMHRLRLEALLDRSPRLLGLWSHDEGVGDLEFSRDSRRLVWCAGPAWISDLDAHEAQAVQLPHQGTVAHAAFSPDGSLVLTAGQDGTARLWKTESLEPACAPLQHRGPVLYACFSDDGRLIATASRDGTARLWNAGTGERVGPPLKHEGPVNHVSFRSDGLRVATSSDDKQVKIWIVPEGKLLRDGFKHGAAVRESWFSARGGRLLSVSGSKIGIWDPEAGRLVVTTIAHRNLIHHATFSDDGRRVLTASQDGTAGLWDAETGDRILPPLQHGLGVPTAFFSPDGWRIITASYDGVVRFWSSSTGKEVLPPLYHRSGLGIAKFSPDGNRVATGCWEHVARVWDLTAIAPEALFLRHAGTVRSAEFSPDGLRAITASFDRTARIWDTRTGDPIGAPLRHEGIVTSATFSPNGRLILTASRDGKARVWDMETDSCILSFSHSRPVYHAAFSPDGRLVATASADGTAVLWSAATGEKLAGPLRHKAGVLHAQFSPDGKLLATSSEDGTACLWATADGRQVVPPMTQAIAEPRSVLRSEFSRDGLRLLAGSGTESGAIWDTESGKAVTPFLKHTANVEAVAFSPDGWRAATGSIDTTARVWDARNGQALTPPLQHGSFVSSVSFSPGGQMLLTACTDGRARVWDSGTGELVLVPIEHQGPVGSASFSPDGRQIITCSQDGTAALWTLPTRSRSHEEYALVASLLSQHRIDATGGAARLETSEVLSAGKKLRSTYPQESARSARETEAWQFQEARLCEREKCWPQAISHLDRLVAAHATDSQYRLERANDFAEAGDFGRAAADYEEMLKLEPDEPMHGYLAALLRYRNGSGEGYSNVCQGLLDRVGRDGFSSEKANVVALACVLGPRAVPDLARVELLAGKAVELSPRAPEAHTLLGAVLYRAGKFEAAARELEGAVASGGNTGSADALFLLAMALQSLGRKEEAMERLRVGQTRKEKGLPPIPYQLSTRTLRCEARLRKEVLQAEAQKLLGPVAAGADTLDKLLWKLNPFLPKAVQPPGPGPKAPRER